MSRLEYSYFYLDNPKRMIQEIKRITPIIFLLFSFMSHAQKSAVYEYADKEYMKGLDLYENQKYGAAREVFAGYLAANPASRSEIRSEASYYLAMSAVELRNDDAEYLHLYQRVSGQSPCERGRLQAGGLFL